MPHIGYYKSRRGWRRIKGFRVNSGRLSIHRLRVRFLDFIRLFRRWKSACNQALDSLKKGIRKSTSKGHHGSRRNLMADAPRPEYKSRSYGRSNSFYAEAIADCLEFIKRSALAMNDDDDDDDDGSVKESTLEGGGYECM